MSESNSFSLGITSKNFFELDKFNNNSQSSMSVGMFNSSVVNGINVNTYKHGDIALTSCSVLNDDQIDDDISLNMAKSPDPPISSIKEEPASNFRSSKYPRRKMSNGYSPYANVSGTSYSERFSKLKMNAKFIHNKGKCTVRRESVRCDEDNPFFIDHAYSKPKSEWFKEEPPKENDSDTDTADEDELTDLLENLTLDENERTALNNRKFAIEISKAVNSQRSNCERQIWSGILEWNDKQSKNPSDITRQVPCIVTSNAKDGEPEVKVENWPQKLVMQLLPKPLIGNIGGTFLKNSTSVLFHPSPCEALVALTNMMSTGFAGCVQFNSMSTPNCEIKVLILLYTTEKNAYLGFIPNDQVSFVDRLRKLIQQRKNTTAAIRQGQAGPNLNVAGSQTLNSIANIQGPPGRMGRTMMPNPNINSMNNPMNGQQSQMETMVGSLPRGGINPAEAMMQTQNNQQTIIHQNPNPLNVPQAAMGLRGNVGMLAQRPQINDHSLEVTLARQQNLAKIQQLRQTLAAAQQQELQYQNQLEQQPTPFGRHQMVNMQKPALQPPQNRNIHTNVQATSQSASQFDDVSGFDFLN